MKPFFLSDEVIAIENAESILKDLSALQGKYMLIIILMEDCFS